MQVPDEMSRKWNRKAKKNLCPLVKLYLFHFIHNHLLIQIQLLFFFENVDLEIQNTQQAT